MATSFLNFDKKYAVAGSSKLKATTVGHIYNIEVNDDVLENGAIITKGAYVRPEVYEQGAATANFKAVVLGAAGNGNYYVEVKEADGNLLVLSVPAMYASFTTPMQHESNFYNAKGDIARAYELHNGDIFELSAEGFTYTPIAAEDAVTVDGTTKKLKKDQ